MNRASRGRGSVQLRSLMPWLVLAFLVWLVGYPLLVVAAEAFGIGGPDADGPTTEAFRSFFTRADEWNAMWRTLWISVLSTLAAAAIGVPLGFLFERNEIPGRRLLGALVALPVALPPLVGVIAFLFLYGESGLAARGLQTLGGSPGRGRSSWSTRTRCTSTSTCSRGRGCRGRTELPSKPRRVWARAGRRSCSA
ncbi:MAG: hypothetical protein J4F98_14855 [Acidobacteria bacterium]|nr:hypothetical protein [Acidobacteriota bacterium]